MEIKKIELNDLVELKKRVYRVGWTKWSNGKEQGNRVILRLLKEKELVKLVLELENEKIKQ